jgi:hypothetical protein
MFIPIVGGAILLQIVTLSFLSIAKKPRPIAPKSSVLHVSEYHPPTSEKRRRTRRVA